MAPSTGRSRYHRGEVRTSSFLASWFLELDEIVPSKYLIISQLSRGISYKNIIRMFRTPGYENKRRVMITGGTSRKATRELMELSEINKKRGKTEALKCLKRTFSILKMSAVKFSRKWNIPLLNVSWDKHLFSGDGNAFSEKEKNGHYIYLFMHFFFVILRFEVMDPNKLSCVLLPYSVIPLLTFRFFLFSNHLSS